MEINSIGPTAISGGMNAAQQIGALRTQYAKPGGGPPVMAQLPGAGTPPVMSPGGGGIGQPIPVDPLGGPHGVPGPVVPAGPQGGFVQQGGGPGNLNDFLNAHKQWHSPVQALHASPTANPLPTGAMPPVPAPVAAPIAPIAPAAPTLTPSQFYQTYGFYPGG